jgi:hypothetical protein
MQSASLPTCTLNLTIHDLTTLEFLISEALRHIKSPENILDAEEMHLRIKRLSITSDLGRSIVYRSIGMFTDEQTSDLGRSPASSLSEVGREYYRHSFSVAVGAIEEIVSLPDDHLKELVSYQEFAFYHGLLTGLLSVLEVKIGRFTDEQTSDLGRSPASSLSEVGQEGNQ